MGETTFKVDKENLQVRMERVFDASPERVFKALTDPEQIPKWWGPTKYITIVDKMDVKVGGVWRFIHKDADGNEYSFNGVYKEITPFKRLVNTFEYEPWAGHVLTETMELEDLGGGKTKVKTTSVYTNIGDLERMVGSGMEKGAREGWDRLAKLVE